MWKSRTWIRNGLWSGTFQSEKLYRMNKQLHYYNSYSLICIDGVFSGNQSVLLNITERARAISLYPVALFLPSGRKDRTRVCCHGVSLFIAGCCSDMGEWIFSTQSQWYKAWSPSYININDQWSTPAGAMTFTARIAMLLLLQLTNGRLWLQLTACHEAQRWEFVTKFTILIREPSRQ